MSEKNYNHFCTGGIREAPAFKDLRPASRPAWTTGEGKISNIIVGLFWFNVFVLPGA